MPSMRNSFDCCLTVPQLSSMTPISDRNPVNNESNIKSKRIHKRNTGESIQSNDGMV